MYHKSLTEVKKLAPGDNSIPILCIGLAIGCTLAAFSGCIDSEHYGQEEYIDLTYRQYIDRFALRDFNPIGAERINYYGKTGRDSYDSWWKIEISRQGWLDICSEIGLGQPQPYTGSSSSQLGVPENWPQPLASAPDWWIPASEFGTELVTSQEDWKAGKRATGWYWLYDDSSSTAIGWHWNYQYWKFETHEL